MVRKEKISMIDASDTIIPRSDIKPAILVNTASKITMIKSIAIPATDNNPMDKIWPKLFLGELKAYMQILY